MRTRSPDPRPIPKGDGTLILPQVTEAVLESRRYRWVAPELVARLAGNELPRSRDVADAVKRTKRRLHQVCGAYVFDVRPERALAELTAATRSGRDEALRAACRALMQTHASTRERLPFLDEFYRRIFDVTRVPQVVLDLACGLGPLALPWMGLPPAARYVAYDVDRRLIELVDGFLTLCGIEHEVELRDVVARPPEAPADVAFLLKSAPCLEQQASGATRRLLRALQARRVVVSFPTRSLGGVRKGMVEHYRAQFEAIVAGDAWHVVELSFPMESVYILQRGGK